LLAFEIKQHRQVAPPAEFVADSIQDGFPLRSEAPQDQNRLRSDRVDDVADFLVVQKQI
jgi:hypothetical protein